MGIVQPGYIGVLTVDGDKRIRCNSFSVNPNQSVTFFNHVIGLKDTIPSDWSTKGEYDPLSEPLKINTQRRIWRPSVISISGGISLPASEESLELFFNHAKYGDYFDLDFNYYCRLGKRFVDCRVNTFEFSVQAGEEAQISMDIVALQAIEETTEMISFEEPEKLLTWDRVKMTFQNAPFNLDKDMIRGFSFNINNNATPIYVAKAIPSSDLFPQDIRLGMQEVSGSLIVYLKQGYDLIPNDLQVPTTIDIDADVWSTSIDVVFNSNKMEGVIGPVVTELPFVGVDKAFGS